MEVPCDLADLPPELITNILERVPKESLLRSRCVTKRWRRLIDDRFSTKLLLYLFPMFSSSINCIDLRRPGDFEEIENPLGWERMVLLGSCRGFLCIYNEDDGQAAIWNPSTRSCQRLPPADAEIAHRLGPACVYGFGYDDRNEECVLLRLVQTLEDSIVSAVSIYRSRASVWRRLQGIPPYSLVDPRTMGVFLNGRLHWIMRINSRDLMEEEEEEEEQVVVAFDIHTENTVHLYFFREDRVPRYLAVLEGYLCVIDYEEGGDVNVWIAREYGSEESWHSLFSIADYWKGRVLLQPLAYSQNDAHSQNDPQVLLLYNETLVWYDLQTKDVKEFHGMPGFFEAATCFFPESHLKRSVIWLFGGDPPRLYGINSLMDVAEIEYPPWGRQVRLLGSGPHVLCISKVDDGQVALWNLTTRSHRLLPPADAKIPLSHILDSCYCIYGFGYDDRNNDYVLLRLVQTRNEQPFIFAVSIYRSRANAWRWLQDIPYYMTNHLAGPQRMPCYLADPETMGVFGHGRLYWIMRCESMYNPAAVLMAFDFCTESFVNVDLPNDLYDLGENLIDNWLCMDLANLGEGLCLTCTSYDQPGTVHVWIMRDIGFRNFELKWDLLFSLNDLWSNFQPVQPLAQINDGFFIAMGDETRTLGRYNLSTSEVEQIHINGMPSSFVVVGFFFVDRRLINWLE